MAGCRQLQVSLPHTGGCRPIRPVVRAPAPGLSVVPVQGLLPGTPRSRENPQLGYTHLLGDTDDFTCYVGSLLWRFRFLLFSLWGKESGSWSGPGTGELNS